MATMDRFEAARERSERDARRADLSLLASPMVWFGLAIVGMLTVFIGLGVDAYKHNNGVGEESLLSFTNPGHLIAGIGLVVTTLAVLAGFTAAALHGLQTARDAVRRFIPVTAAWAAVAAIGLSSVTYIGASDATVGHDHGDDASAAAHDHGEDPTGGDAAIGAMLQDRGLLGADGSDDVDPSTVAGALRGADSGNPEHAHDHGKQPTFAQWMSLSDEELMPLFPEGAMTLDQVGPLRKQIMQVRAVAEKFPTTQAAEAAGYINTTSDVPFMGMHYLHFGLVSEGKFDPEKPHGLLFSKVDSGPPKLVGVWFLIIPGAGGNGITRTVQPEGYIGGLDLWHAHVGLCLVGTSSASEGETRESCDAKGGRFTADLRWMMHTWVAPGFDNPEGVFTYLNADLYRQQVAAQRANDTPSGTTGD